MRASTTKSQRVFTNPALSDCHAGSPEFAYPKGLLLVVRVADECIDPKPTVKDSNGLVAEC